MQRRTRPGLLIIALMLALLGARTVIQTQAQGQELLQNPQLTAYYGTGQGDSVVPVGWELTTSASVRSAQQKWLFNEFPGFTASWEVTGNDKTFTMYGIQFVPGVRAGTKLRFSAYGNVFTCNDRSTSCIDGALGKRVSDQGSQARVRIGVDPNGGKDPNAASVVWSSYVAPFDRFEQLNIDFESKNDNGVTVFLNATQAVPMAINSVYWDRPSLQTIGPGSPFAPAQPPASPTPAGVPFVTPQGQQPDGSIVHIVAPGDTLLSIAYAYKVSVDDIRQLNNIPPGEYVIQIGQRLLIKPPQLAVTYVVVTNTPTTDPNAPPPVTSTVTPTPTGTRISPYVTLITLVPGQ
jgi:hypothetical protein